MPLDPQAEALLEQLAALGLPPYRDRTPEEVRAGIRAMSLGTAPPANPAPTADRRIPGAAGDIAVRVYRPDAPGPLPVVVFFHGGGFVIGDLDTHDGICHALATGVPAVVVSVDYRLAPEHPFPAAVEDCWAALRWVHANAGGLGADAGRLAVAGDSAGGNLAAVTAVRARDAGGPPVACQVLVYPCTDLTRSFASQRENAEGYLLTADGIDWFYGHYVPEGTDPRHPELSPLFADDLGGLPPAVVLTAEFDPLRDEGEAYAASLQAAGVETTLKRYPGMIHGFYGLDGVFDAAREAAADVIAVLRRHLAGEPAAAVS